MGSLQGPKLNYKLNYKIKLNYKMVGCDNDVVIVIFEKFGGTMSEVMQGALSSVKDWYDREGLSINPEKPLLYLSLGKRIKLD